MAAGILGLTAGIFYCITGNLPVAGIVLAASALISFSGYSIGRRKY